MSLLNIYKKLEALNNKKLDLGNRESGDINKVEYINGSINNDPVKESIHRIEQSSVDKYKVDDIKILNECHPGLIDTKIKLGESEGVLHIYDDTLFSSNIQYSTIPEKILKHFLITKESIINFDYNMGPEYKVEYYVYDHKLKLKLKGKDDCVSHLDFLTKINATSDNVIGPNIVEKITYDKSIKKSLVKYFDTKGAIAYIPCNNISPFMYIRYDLRHPKNIIYSKAIQIYNGKVIDELGTLDSISSKIKDIPYSIYIHNDNVIIDTYNLKSKLYVNSINRGDLSQYIDIDHIITLKGYKLAILDLKQNKLNYLNIDGDVSNFKYTNGFLLYVKNDILYLNTIDLESYSIKNIYDISVRSKNIAVDNISGLICIDNQYFIKLDSFEKISYSFGYYNEKILLPRIFRRFRPTSVRNNDYLTVDFPNIPFNVYDPKEFRSYGRTTICPDAYDIDLYKNGTGPSSISTFNHITKDINGYRYDYNISGVHSHLDIENKYIFPITINLYFIYDYNKRQLRLINNSNPDIYNQIYSDDNKIFFNKFNNSSYFTISKDNEISKLSALDFSMNRCCWANGDEKEYHIENSRISDRDIGKIYDPYSKIFAMVLNYTSLYVYSGKLDKSMYYYNKSFDRVTGFFVIDNKICILSNNNKELIKILDNGELEYKSLSEEVYYKLSRAHVVNNNLLFINEDPYLSIYLFDSNKLDTKLLKKIKLKTDRVDSGFDSNFISNNLIITKRHAEEDFSILDINTGKFGLDYKGNYKLVNKNNILMIQSKLYQLKNTETIEISGINTRVDPDRFHTDNYGYDYDNLLHSHVFISDNGNNTSIKYLNMY